MAEGKYGKETLQVIHDLHQSGIKKISVIMRHSARNYDDDMKMEPFMWLTDEGRAFAANLGEGLPENKHLRLFSSYIGRCIETAYQVDKGYIKVGGNSNDTLVTKDVSPFYVLDFKKTVGIIMEQDVATFIRNWINGNIGEDILMNAKACAAHMLSFMTGKLGASVNGTLDISITHDWNMYLLKEFGLGLPHEEYGKIDYLEGVVVFENDGEYYITNYQKKPERLLL